MPNRDTLTKDIFDTIPYACNYWIEKGEQDDTTLTITEQYDGDTDPLVITLADLPARIDKWCTDYAKGHSYRYFDRFAKDWLWGDYDLADYDHEVVDSIVQFTFFGRMIYG